jgi:hypothetical protein
MTQTIRLFLLLEGASFVLVALAWGLIVAARVPAAAARVSP